MYVVTAFIIVSVVKVAMPRDSSQNSGGSTTKTLIGGQKFQGYKSRGVWLLVTRQRCGGGIRLTDGTVGYELSSGTGHQKKIARRRPLRRGRRGGRRSLQRLRCGRLGCRWRWLVRRRSHGSIGRRRGDLSGKLRTLRRIWEVPRARDHSGGHDPVDARERYSRQCVERGRAAYQVAEHMTPRPWS